MPKRVARGKKRHAKKRRHGKRKSRFVRPTKSIMKAGFPDRLFTKLKYEEMFNSGAQVGGIVYEYVFRGNSAFDPNFTASGHQPTYFDQYAAVYNKYRVHASSIKVTPFQDSTNGAGYFLCVVPTDGSNPFSTFTDYAQQSYAKVIPVKLGAGKQQVRSMMSTKKKFGLKGIDQEEDCAAAVTTNPSEQWYWFIAVDNIDSAGSFRVNFMVEMNIYVEFYDRVDEVQSLERKEEQKVKPPPSHLLAIADKRKKDTTGRMFKGRAKEDAVVVPHAALGAGAKVSRK